MFLLSIYPVGFLTTWIIGSVVLYEFVFNDSIIGRKERIGISVIFGLQFGFLWPISLVGLIIGTAIFYIENNL